MLSRVKKDLAPEVQKILPQELQFSSGQIENLFELPKDSSHGDLAFPCFQLSKALRKAPPAIAAELAQKFSKPPPGVSKVVALGGYLNFHFDENTWAHLVISEIQKQGKQLGHMDVGKNKVVVLDYSSPNVAKPMSIGHLRSTVIGQSLKNLFEAMGYKAIGINHLGDWGVQFGKLAWAYQNWGKEYDFKKAPFDSLFKIYVRFHTEAETKPELEDYGRATFKKLEDGDPEVRKIWQLFLDISIAEYQRVYDLLGIKFDHIQGEAFYNEMLEDVVGELKKKKLLIHSEGAEVVDLTAYNMPPCLIKKSDGATLYATRDLAAALYRHRHYKADKIIYVVGSEQSLHFQQLFKVLELMGESWAKDCVHVPFGLYRFKEGKMSTRRGNVIFLEDVLDRAIELVREVIKQKNPDLKDPERIAEIVGTGAVVFNDLMNDRVKGIDFDWDKILDFQGDTGPYVQYTHVRCCSVLAKWGKPIPGADAARDYSTSQERELLRKLGQFDHAVYMAYQQLKPNIVAQYLLDLAKAFNSFYYECRILEGDMKVQNARVALTDASRAVIAKGLALLGIKAPEQM